MPVVRLEEDFPVRLEVGQGLRRGDGVAQDDYRGFQEGVVRWGGGVGEFEAETLFGWERDVEGEGLVEITEVGEGASVVVADGEAAVGWVVRLLFCCDHSGRFVDPLRLHR